MKMYFPCELVYVLYSHVCTMRVKLKMNIKLSSIIIIGVRSGLVSHFSLAYFFVIFGSFRNFSTENIVKRSLLHRTCSTELTAHHQASSYTDLLIRGKLICILENPSITAIDLVQLM